MRLGLALVLCASALAQGWGRREAMRPWAQGRFSEAEQQFAQMRRFVPVIPQMLLWEAEFEIERARFGQAAALIKEAQKTRTADTQGLAERRLARLLLSVGRFDEAQRIASEGHQWNGKNVTKLKVSSAMDLVTLGEIALVRADYATAISLFEKAEAKSKSVSSLDGLEWIRY